LKRVVDGMKDDGLAEEVKVVGKKESGARTGSKRM
jgi:hypothetical protein